jgi:hypothetical protein
MQRYNEFQGDFIGEGIFNKKTALLTSEFMECVNPPMPEKPKKTGPKKVEKDLKKAKKIAE